MRSGAETPSTWSLDPEASRREPADPPLERSDLRPAGRPEDRATDECRYCERDAESQQRRRAERPCCGDEPDRPEACTDKCRPSQCADDGGRLRLRQPEGEREPARTRG